VKLLLDENLPHRLRLLLVGHEGLTVGFLRWKGIKNGELLRRAAVEGFDAVVTNDRNMPAQQNPTSLPLAIVVLNAPSSELEDIAPLVPELLQKLGAFKPKTFIHIGAG